MLVPLRLEIVVSIGLILLLGCSSAPLRPPASRVLTPAEEAVKYTSPDDMPNLTLVPTYRWDFLRDFYFRNRELEKTKYIEGDGK